MKLKTFKFDSVPKPINKEYRGKDWVMWGENNNYPEWLIDLYNTSALHSTIIKSKQEQIIGQGIRSSTNADIVNQVVNSDMETIDDVLKKVALDYILFGGFSLNIIWTNDKSDFEIYHIDYSNVRCGKKDEDDKVMEYFYTTNWNNTRKYKPERYEAFDFKGNDESSTIYCYTPYSPGKNYYPMPDYSGALTSINLDKSMIDFHDHAINNGLSPNVWINIPQDMEDEELFVLERQIKENFGGIEGGKFILTSSDGDENKPNIQTIDITTNDDYYTTINDITTRNILSSHRITSPLLIGIRDTGSSGLGSNKDEILVAFEHFTNVVIKPYQDDILSVFEKLYAFKNNGSGVSLYFESYELFGDEEIVDPGGNMEEITDEIMENENE